MKKNFRLILYIIIILVILGGLSLFIFKDSVLKVLRQETGVNSAAKVTDISGTAVTVASSSALDTSILKLPRFVALVNQVTNFDFANICWRPDVAVSQPIVPKIVGETSTEATSTEEEAAVNCVQGNSLPFSVKKK
ncbi:MAG: hypothetical protein NTY31_01090 [Candidatus Falkowbacteria bacterium]|nr:hypothetical protein [Candidatus Falkowbacteria bacterium]